MTNPLEQGLKLITLDEPTSGTGVKMTNPLGQAR